MHYNCLITCCYNRWCGWEVKLHEVKLFTFVWSFKIWLGKFCAILLLVTWEFDNGIIPCILQNFLAVFLETGFFFVVVVCLCQTVSSYLIFLGVFLSNIFFFLISKLDLYAILMDFIFCFWFHLWLFSLNVGFPATQYIDFFSSLLDVLCQSVCDILQQCRGVCEVQKLAWFLCILLLCY